MVALVSEPAVARAEGLLASAARLAGASDRRAFAQALRDLAKATAALRLEIAAKEDQLRVAIEPLSERIRDESGATTTIEMLALLHDLTTASETQLIQLAGRRPSLDPRAVELVKVQIDGVLGSLGGVIAAAKKIDMSPLAEAVQNLLDAEYAMINADPTLAARVERAFADIEAGRVGEPATARELTDALNALAAKTH